MIGLVQRLGQQATRGPSVAMGRLVRRTPALEQLPNTQTKSYKEDALRTPDDTWPTANTSAEEDAGADVMLRVYERGESRYMDDMSPISSDQVVESLH